MRNNDRVRIATVNVNGIRAAARRGMAQWLEGRDVDVLCLQEVRAPGPLADELLQGMLGEVPGDWTVLGSVCAQKGRAGVALAARLPVAATREGIGDPDRDSGRWLETDLTLPDGRELTVVSAYVHSGEVDTPRQDAKYAFLDAMTTRLPELAAEHELAVVVGDLNVGHTTLDIKNWRGNVKRAGFLPEERAYFDRFFGDLGWVDVARRLAGEVPGPYTWWSWRGQAFANDTGWRIDYHMATPSLADLAKSAVVDRPESYEARFSDHAPLVVDYDL